MCDMLSVNSLGSAVEDELASEHEFLNYPESIELTPGEEALHRLPPLVGLVRQLSKLCWRSEVVLG